MGDGWDLESPAQIFRCGWMQDAVLEPLPPFVYGLSLHQAEIGELAHCFERKHL